MTNALALTRVRLARKIDLLDTARSAIVLSCAGALIAAGSLVPTLG